MKKFLLLIITLLPSCQDSNIDAEELTYKLENLSNKIRYLEEEVDKNTSEIEKLQNKVCQDFKNIKEGDIVKNENGIKRRIMKINDTFYLISLDPTDDGVGIWVKNGVKTLEEIINYMKDAKYTLTNCKEIL